jgi:hypothetical protein
MEKCGEHYLEKMNGFILKNEKWWEKSGGREQIVRKMKSEPGPCCQSKK